MITNNFWGLFFFRMAYKDDYEKFKLKMTVISMVFTILNLYIFNYRYTNGYNLYKLKHILCFSASSYK